MTLRLYYSGPAREKFGTFVVYFKSLHIDGNILPMDKPTARKGFISLCAESLFKKITEYLNYSFH